MNTMRLSAACALLCASALPALAQTTENTVTSIAGAGNTTPGVWFESDMRGAGTVEIIDLTGLGGNLENSQPLPVSAVRLTTDADNNSKAEIGVADDYGTANDILDSLQLAYSYHKASNADQNLASAPGIKLAFWNEACPGGGDCYGQLVYEPYWNQASNPGVSVNPPLDAWTEVTIDKDNGLFWTTGMFGAANSAGGPPLRTLAEWANVLNEDFGTSNLVLVSVGVGTYNQNQLGYFDEVTIVHDSYGQAYDFELEPEGGPQATFLVTSAFSDGNPAATEVTLTCNGGVPLQQDFTLTGGDSGVTFTVSDFVEGTTRCEVTQAGSPDGYTVSFDDGSPSADSCVFETVQAGDYACAITGTLEPVQFLVGVVYDISPEAERLDSTITMDWFCENFRTGPAGDLISESGSFELSEDETSSLGLFFPNYTTPESRCRFEPRATASAVELDGGCLDWVVMQPGDEEVSCTVSATIFFEGIPALDPRGLAVLALLMLGVGFYGLRRVT